MLRSFGGSLPLALAALVVLVALSGPGHAQEEETVASDSDRAAAQVLFNDARTLMDQEKYVEACNKFRESQRLDPQTGTQLNLARCYEKLGKWASAWVNYVDAATRARKSGQEERVKIAEERAAEIEGKISRVKIVVTAPPEGFVLKRDGEVVGQAQWGTEVPIDPGDHTLVAEAPGKLAWRHQFRVPEEPETVSVEVPALEDAPVDKPVEEKPDPMPQVAGGVVLGVIGLAGIGLGIGMGITAGSKNDESLGLCKVEDANQCTPEGVSLRDEAFTFAHVSTAGFVVGGAAIATGLIVILTAPGLLDGDEGAGDEGVEEEPVAEEEARVLPWAGPDGCGMMVEARW
jgi:hypothetical protein